MLRNVNIISYNPQHEMKFVKILIYVILFILYAYSCYMTSADSKHVIWGYICAVDFGILFLILVSFFTEYRKKKEDQKNKLENL
jgi:hypothetical protein